MKCVLDGFDFRGVASSQPRPITNLSEEKRNSLEQFVSEEAELAGYSLEKVRSLSIHDSIQLAYEITANRLTFTRNPDEIYTSPRDQKFLQILKTFQNIPENVKVEETTCGAYATTFMNIFHILSSLNPNLKNTYVSEVSDHWFGPNQVGHAYSQATTVSERVQGDPKGGYQLSTTFLDSRRADAGGRLVATDRHYGPGFSKLKENMRFYAKYLLANFDVEVTYSQELLKQHPISLK